MNTSKHLALGNFFKDNNGHVIIWQWPNVPLYGWIILKLVVLVVSKGRFKDGCEQLAMAFLFAWALLEITQGVNYFRRFLGLIVGISIVLSYFR
jgi:hypothetical protein